MKQYFCPFALSALVLGGCANTAEYLRSQPVTHFQAEPTITIPEELNKLISVRCTKELDSSDTVNGKVIKQCLYISADAGNLINSIKATESAEIRDKTITLLTSISDMNCSNYLHRTFANKAGLDFTKSFTSDLATGVSAGTAFANPAISSGLSVSNLIIGKGVESFNSTYYFDKTFQALEAAITAERLRIKTYITARQAQTNIKDSHVKYEVVQALSDIRAYDDACSIKAGLAQLVQLADAKKDTEIMNRVSVELSPKPVEAALKLYGAKIPGPGK